MHKTLLLASAAVLLVHAFDIPKFKGYNYKFTEKVNKTKLSVRLQKLKIGPSAELKFIKPTLCPPFMEFSNCACDRSCVAPDLKCENCLPGCVCRGGFLRNDLRHCVLPEECPKESNPLERVVMIPQKLYQAVPIKLGADIEPKKEEPMEPSPPSTRPRAMMSEPAAPSGPSVSEPAPTLVFLRNGPTPPPGPPMINAADLFDMVGAPSATPPPEFHYGPPGMNAERYQQLDSFLKRRRLLKALRQRRMRLRSRQ
ncbi:unnamed protein product [Caenorhabditis auriculariae]|uniref:TIL domain-containing protein n=1 Tax=Caenorhabditis auriculariae TaxID=2777116 RepID=A0A8S1HLY9_9PELO|nr:unnamed protein product [Caenorhabditis auriculariae]